MFKMSAMVFSAYLCYVQTGVYCPLSYSLVFLCLSNSILNSTRSPLSFVLNSAVTSIIPIELCFIPEQYALKNLAVFEATTSKIEHEDLSHLVEDIANGEGVSLHYVWFVMPMMQICHIS
jgi:hypothetical protein